MVLVLDLVFQVWCCVVKHDLVTLDVIMILRDTETFQVLFIVSLSVLVLDAVVLVLQVWCCVVMMEVVVTTGTTRRAKLQSNCHHQQTNTQFFTGRLPFLSPNQQCQSTEGIMLTDTLVTYYHTVHFSAPMRPLPPISTARKQLPPPPAHSEHTNINSYQ